MNNQIYDQLENLIANSSLLQGTTIHIILMEALLWDNNSVQFSTNTRN